MIAPKSAVGAVKENVASSALLSASYAFIGHPNFHDRFTFPVFNYLNALR